MTSDTTTTAGGGGDIGNNNRGEYSEELRDNFDVSKGHGSLIHGEHGSGNEYGKHRGNRYSASITGPILGRETYQYFHDTMANKSDTGNGSEGGKGSLFQRLGESLVEGTKQLESGSSVEGDDKITDNTAESETEAEDVSDTVPERETSSYFANVVSSAPAFKPQQGSSLPPSQQYFFGFPPQIYGSMFPPHPPVDSNPQQQQQQTQQHFPVIGSSNFLSHIIHPGLPPSAPMLQQGRVPVPFPVPIPVQIPTSQGSVLKEGSTTSNKEVTGVPNIRPETPTAMATPDLPGTFLPVPQPGAPEWCSLGLMLTWLHPHRNLWFHPQRMHHQNSLVHLQR